MIKDFIVCEEKKILQELQKYEEAKNELELLIKKKEELEKEIKEAVDWFASKTMPLPIVYRKFNIFQKIFSREYKEYVKLREKYELEKKVAEEEIVQKERETKETKKELEVVKLKIAKQESVISSVNGKELQQRIVALRDKKEAVKIILAINTELAKNVEFMKEVVEIDVNLIQYDDTDDLQLYTYVLEKIKGNPDIKRKNASNALFIRRTYEEIIEKIQEELRQPKDVEEDKYKIPTKYLYEAIRKGFRSKELFNDIDSYFDYDGNISKETGEKIQQLYEDEENYLLMHGIFCESEGDCIAKKICLEGLRCSGQDEDCINNLERTTIGNYGQEAASLFTFLSCVKGYNNNRMLISIPKKMINENEPIWGSDSREIIFGEEEGSYLLPQYIFGFIRNTDKKIIENPIPIDQRKKYKYKFRSQETKAYIEENEFAKD